MSEGQRRKISSSRLSCVRSHNQLTPPVISAERPGLLRAAKSKLKEKSKVVILPNQDHYMAAASQSGRSWQVQIELRDLIRTRVDKVWVKWLSTPATNVRLELGITEWGFV